MNIVVIWNAMCFKWLTWTYFAVLTLKCEEEEIFFLENCLHSIFLLIWDLWQNITRADYGAHRIKKHIDWFRYNILHLLPASMQFSIRNLFVKCWCRTRGALDVDVVEYIKRIISKMCEISKMKRDESSFNLKCGFFFSFFRSLSQQT